METDYPKIFAATGPYTESSWSFMTPPNEADLSTLKNRGAKMIVFHGVADGVFSPMDTANWMDRLQANHSGKADAFARPGGAGILSHFSDVLAAGRASAVLAASLFHFGTLTIPQVKNYLGDRGRPIPPLGWAALCPRQGPQMKTVLVLETVRRHPD
eukprot:gene62025-84828_t